MVRLGGVKDERERLKPWKHLKRSVCCCSIPKDLQDLQDEQKVVLMFQTDK